MILCCGEALIDMVPVSLPGGGEGFLPLPGGSPCNTAIAAARLGVPVKVLGRLSTDFFGDLLVNNLKKNKVGTELILRGGENSTLAFVKLEEGKEPRYAFYTEGAADRSFSAADLPEKLPADTRCILFGSIAMTMEPVAGTIETLIRREGAGENPPVISFDPNIRSFMIADRPAYLKRLEGWIRSAVIVKISGADYDFIYPGLPLEKSMKKVLGMGPRIAVTTLGKDGALALLRREDGSVIRASAPVVDLPVRDTIGAGDTFHGALLAWLEMKGRMSRTALAALGEAELREALFFANKAASLVCARQGADPPSLAELEALEPAAGTGKG
jgi:fructokinase